MEYSLYTYYGHSPLNLYQIREHYIEHFYCRKYSRKKVDKVVEAVVCSTKVGHLLEESAYYKATPNYEDFLSVICSMWKFMFKSKETHVLAVIVAALRWDIEVNSELHFISSEELKKEIIKVFDKFSVYEEMGEEEYHSVAVVPTVDAEVVEEPKEKHLLEHNPHQTVWTFLAFTQEFGSDIFVGKFHRRDDGEAFYSCILTDDDGHKTFIGFSSKLGVLTADEIAMRKEELVVIKSPSGNYNLYKDNGTAWKKVKI